MMIQRKEGFWKRKQSGYLDNILIKIKVLKNS